MDASLFEPVPAGRPRLDPSKIGGSSMYAPSVRRVVADDEEYDRSGLSGRPRVPQSTEETALPPATFPPSYYETGAQQVGPGPEARQPVPPEPEAEPAPRRRWLVPRLLDRLRDRGARAERPMEPADYDSVYEPVRE